MFTGLVQAVGSVRQVTAAGEEMQVVVDLAGLPQPPRIGDSVALSGVCCTVIEYQHGRGSFHLSRETLARTWLRQLVPGSLLNLEAALRAGDPLGGHYVQGHVDGVGAVASDLDPQRGGDWLVRLPENLLRYCVEKGSISLDGVSLTLAGIEGDVVRIAIIPHTAQVTTLGRKSKGEPLHVEVDVLAKYVERLLPSQPR